MKLSILSKKNSSTYLLLLVLLTTQLVSCVVNKELALNRHETYWTNKNYLVSNSQQFEFTKEEHLFQLSDSLVVHKTIVNNRIASRHFEISHVSHKGAYESIFHAKKYYLIFHLDKKNNILKIFSRQLNRLRNGNRLIMAHVHVQKVEEIPDEYASGPIGLTTSK